MSKKNDNTNIIERAYEVFAGVQKKIGGAVPDEESFVGGFVACFGILTGRVDIGLDQHAPLDRILDSIHKDIAAFAEKHAGQMEDDHTNH